MEGLVLVPRRAHRSLNQKSAQQVGTVETSGQNTAKKHSKTITDAQLDGKKSSWPPVRGLRSSAPSLPSFFLGTNKKETVTLESFVMPAPPSQNVRIKIAWSGVRVPVKRAKFKYAALPI
jgi:hypothetical protein